MGHLTTTNVDERPCRRCKSPVGRVRVCITHVDSEPVIVICERCSLTLPQHAGAVAMAKARMHFNAVRRMVGLR